VKYGQAGGQVQVKIDAGGSDDRGAVALAVLGDGPAVDPAVLARLVDRFYRADGHSAQGSGLGLSIVDKIARAYGGSLQLGRGLDGAGFGATVRFTA
ncbi:MAG: integral rane sensor signal transduction histidine kinase, partial [Massilia sp.]|nr:integral rane sensor signal transduction histidine kinase [Massilia sp.]